MANIKSNVLHYDNIRSGLKQGLKKIKEVISGDGEVHGLMHGQP